VNIVLHLPEGMVSMMQYEYCLTWFSSE